MSMRVLVVTQYFWPEGFRINDVVKTLVERGIHVDVLTGKPNYPEGKIFSGYRPCGTVTESWFGATIFRVPLAPRGNGALNLVANYLSFIFSGLIFGPILLRGRKYDVVFVYGLSPILLTIPAIFIAWLRRKRLVIWIQDLWPESLSATGYVTSEFILRSVEIVVRWIYRHADLLLVQSRAFESSVAALAPGKPIIYYPNSVDASFSQNLSEGLDQPLILELEGGFPIIFAGNIGAAQAVECIVDAATLLRAESDIRFVVFGQGSRWEWMRREIEKRGLTNIYLAGRFPVQDMPGYMRKAAVLLVSLIDKPIFSLTVPNKIQAYMASGRPILASLNGEGARLIHEANAGIAVPAEDHKALAEAILKLHSMSKEERHQLGLNGRKYYEENFDHDKLIDQLIGYLQMQRSGSDIN